MEEVGISLSGGGYRASMFHLGSLSYLNHLKLSDGRSFLDIINSISCISGGTITGLWYLMHYYKGNDIAKCFQELYHTLAYEDLPTEILDVFLNKQNKNASLIKEATKVYDKLFFHDETFGNIMDVVQSGHIHHFSANGTDFSSGTAYRFIAMRQIINTDPNYRFATIGNAFNSLPGKIASQIKLSEILAVSSCFPGGFEPMHYPEDFAFSSNPTNKAFVDKEKRYRLMDGGIVDNQGIEPLLLANDHLAFDDPKSKESPDYKSIDLLIISDVSSPFMKPDCEVKQNFYNQITLSHINSWITIGVLFLLAAYLLAYYFASSFMLGMLTAFLLLVLLFRLITFLINRMVRKKLLELPFNYDWRNIRHLTLGKIKTMALSRLDSLLDLSQTVFMRPIRNLRYNQVFSDRGWFNRRITNNITELSTNGVWKWVPNLSEELKPSETMCKNSDMAAGMGTTLWFTEEDKKNGLPEAVFTTGQYTICMNLLDYIDKLKKDSSNTTESHKLIMSCEKQLRNDWEHFLKDPNYLLNLGKQTE